MGNAAVVSDGCSLTRVSPERLALVWPKVEARIQDMMDTSGLYDAADAFTQIDEGKWQLWIAVADTIECIAVTTVVDYPKARVLVILGCAGEDRDRWLDLLASIEDWGRYQKCDRVRPVARPGWERVLKDRGYRKTHVHLEKAL